MAAADFPTIGADKNKDRKPRKTLTWIWVNDGVGTGSPVTAYNAMGLACTLREYADIPMELINDTEISLPGKVIARDNDGVRVGNHNMTLQANDIATQAAIMSQDLTTQPTIRLGKTVSDFGAVLITSFLSDNVTIGACTLLCRASAQFLQAPGTPQSDRNSFEVQMYSDFDQVYQSKGGDIFNLETWYDDGVNIINAAAPNGVLTTFVLGTSNNATTTYTASSAKVMDPSAGTHGKYIPFLAVKNGTTGVWSILRDTVDFTFALATGTITIPGPLPDSSKLVAFWQSTDANATTLGAAAWKSWQTIQGV